MFHKNVIKKDYSYGNFTQGCSRLYTLVLDCFFLHFKASQMQTLFDFMRKYRREDGAEICEAFIRAPKRRTDPGKTDSL